MIDCFECGLAVTQLDKDEGKAHPAAYENTVAFAATKMFGKANSAFGLKVKL